MNMGEVIKVDFRENNDNVSPNTTNPIDISQSDVHHILDLKREKLCIQIAALFGRSRADIKKVSLDSEETLVFYIHGKLYVYCGCVENEELIIDPIVFMKKIVEYQQNNNTTFCYEDISQIYKDGNYIRFYTNTPGTKVIYLGEENIESNSESL